jgi:hypothetical protein
MNIYLTAQDICQMPEPGKTWFLNWLREYLKVKSGKSNQIAFSDKLITKQLNLDLETKDKADRSHIRLTQLLDAGITKPKMAVRVKLTRVRAQKSGREYVNGLEISSKGTVIYQGAEFNKVSPLATAVNGTSNTLNGWEYVEVKKNGAWISLDDLRKPLKTSNT